MSRPPPSEDEGTGRSAEADPRFAVPCKRKPRSEGESRRGNSHRASTVLADFSLGHVRSAGRQLAPRQARFAFGGNGRATRPQTLKNRRLKTRRGDDQLEPKDRLESRSHTGGPVPHRRAGPTERRRPAARTSVSASRPFRNAGSAEGPSWPALPRSGHEARHYFNAKLTVTLARMVSLPGATVPSASD